MLIPLDFPPGLVTDEPDFDNPGWKLGNNMRFWRGKPETDGGWERLSLDPVGGVCRGLFGWTDAMGFRTLAFGLHNGLTVWQEGDQADITPTTGFTPGQIDGTGGSGYGTGAWNVGDYGEPSTADFFPLTWSFGSRRDGYLYANPRNQTIFVWENDTASAAVALTNAPARVQSMLVSPNGQVMAFGCTDAGGNFNQACIRIADAVDPTVWTQSHTNSAQQIYLQGNGRIVGARVVGDYVYVWTDSDLYRLTLTTAWFEERIGASCGLVGPNAAHVVGQTAYWMTPEYQFMGCAPGGTPILLLSADGKPCPVRKDVVEHAVVGQNDKVYAYGLGERSEVAWIYADDRDGLECSRIVRLSTLDGAWSTSQRARTAMLDAFAGLPSSGVDPDGNLFWHERGNSADGAALDWFIETGALYLEPGQLRMMLRKWWPNFVGPDGGPQIGAVSLTIYARDKPQSPEVAYGPFVATADSEKVDVRVSGRIFRLRFSGSSSPAFVSLGKQTFDGEPSSPR